MILLLSNVHSQIPIYSLGPVKITSYSGDIELNSEIRSQNLNNDFYSTGLTDSRFNGGLELNSNGFILHQNFLKFNLSGEFNPGKNSVNYIGLPDIAEVQTYENIGLRTTIFGNRDVSINTFSNYSHLFQMKENLSNVETNVMSLGGAVNYKNKILPVSFNYSQNRNTIKGLEDGRYNEYFQKNISVSSTKSITSNDKTSINYTINDYENKFNNTTIDSRASILRFINDLWLGEERKYTSRFGVILSKRSNHSNYNNLNMSEVINIELPKRFGYMFGYDINTSSDDATKASQHRLNNQLNHQLYESLFSSLFVKTEKTDHTNFNSKQVNNGINVRYRKKVPTGMLNVYYNYSINNFEKLADNNLVTIINEEHLLSSNEIHLLNNPDVILESIIVTDATETIIYRENIDYQAFDRGGYVEIMRIIGGDIVDNQMVLVDYDTESNNSFDYTMVNNRLKIDLSLLSGGIKLYYQTNKNDYKDITNEDAFTTYILDKHVFGIRGKYKFVESGVEYVDYFSNILPYYKWRYYINATKSFNKLNLMLNASFDDYNFFKENRNKNDIRIAGNLEYRMFPKLIFSLYSSRNLQNQQEIRADFFTTRFKVTYQIRQLYVTGGVDYYKRGYQAQVYNLANGYVKIKRVF